MNSKIQTLQQDIKYVELQIEKLNNIIAEKQAHDNKKHSKRNLIFILQHLFCLADLSIKE